jgi:hypothetical protein
LTMINSLTLDLCAVAAAFVVAGAVVLGAL